jgi:hypothetical protein
MLQTMMKRLVLVALLVFAVVPAQAAACYADYKAKRGDPLQLHYGVIELPDDACGNIRRARDYVKERLGKNGWQLLKVLSIFDKDGLDERKKNAGKYFLRY